MVKYENWCVGCTDMGLPCIGQSCVNRRVEVHYCDKCGCELEVVDWGYGYDEYCEDCKELEDEDEIL